MANAVAPPPDPLGAVRLSDTKPVEKKKLFAEIDPAIFAPVEDHVAAQIDYKLFTALKALVDSDERDIEAASLGEVVYSQLNSRPDVYRGEIVTVSGLVRAIQKPAAVNSREIKKYYDVFIRPYGSKDHIRVVCHDLPPDFPYPDGNYLDHKVKVSGFFYQLYKPADKDFEGNDPAIVLAKTMRWTNPAGAAAEAADQAPAQEEERLPGGIPKAYALPALGVGIDLLMFLAVWSYRLSKTSVLNRGPIVGRARRAAEAAKEPENLNSLKIEP